MSSWEWNLVGRDHEGWWPEGAYRLLNEAREEVAAVSQDRLDLYRKFRAALLPNPGSDEAYGQGCRCPILDNHNGLGFLIKGFHQFVMADNCPLHGTTP